MLGMGWNEIMVVMLIAVVVIGPKHLPEVAKGLGKLMAYFRRASNDLRDAINSEIAEHDEAKELRDFTKSFDKEVFSIERQAKDYVEREIEKEEKELRSLSDEVDSTVKSAREELEDSSAEPESENSIAPKGPDTTAETNAATNAMAAAAESIPSETTVMRPSAVPQAPEEAATSPVANAEDEPPAPEKKASAS